MCFICPHTWTSTQHRVWRLLNRILNTCIPCRQFISFWFYYVTAESPKFGPSHCWRLSDYLLIAVLFFVKTRSFWVGSKGWPHFFVFVPCFPHVSIKILVLLLSWWWLLWVIARVLLELVLLRCWNNHIANVSKLFVARKCYLFAADFRNICTFLRQFRTTKKFMA